MSWLEFGFLVAVITFMATWGFTRFFFMKREKQLEQERGDAQDQRHDSIYKWNVASVNLSRVRAIVQRTLEGPRPGEGGPYRCSVEDLIGALEQVRDVTLEKRGELVAEVGHFATAEDAFGWIIKHKDRLINPMVSRLGEMWDGPCYHVVFSHEHEHDSPCDVCAHLQHGAFVNPCGQGNPTTSDGDGLPVDDKAECFDPRKPQVIMALDQALHGLSVPIDATIDDKGVVTLLGTRQTIALMHNGPMTFLYAKEVDAQRRILGEVAETKGLTRGYGARGQFASHECEEVKPSVFDLPEHKPNRQEG